MSELILDRIKQLAIMYDVSYEACLDKYISLSERRDVYDPLVALEMYLHYGY